jgi:hypothetical protein
LAQQPGFFTNVLRVAAGSGYRPQDLQLVNPLNGSCSMYALDLLFALAQLDRSAACQMLSLPAAVPALVRRWIARSRLRGVQQDRFLRSCLEVRCQLEGFHS